MNQEFWNLFSDNYCENCLKWEHSAYNPVIPKTPGGFKANWTANPDILDFKGRKLVYYRGNGITENQPNENHDRMAVAEILGLTEDGNLDFKDLNNGNCIIDVGAKGTFDSFDVLDPATVIFDNKVFLYYSAIGPGADSVGLAVSEDGINFEKKGKIMVGRAPDIVLYENEIYMLYQYMKGNAYQMFIAKSKDGIHFENVQEAPVFIPSPNSWDSFSITTARLFVDTSNKMFYMLYGGSAYLSDEPDYFGLARSQNLLDWEFHKGNPIFGCGAKGTPDGGAIWFPAVFEEKDRFVMLYEGSRGKYTWDLSSQICMSTIKKNK